MAGGPRRVVIRSTFGFWLAGLAAALVVAFTVDALARGAWLFAVTTLPWQLLVVWVIVVVTVRPCVVVTPDALTIINVGRVHVLPWPRIEDIVSRYQLVVTLVGGRRITSWGAPSLGVDRPSITGRMLSRDPRPGQDPSAGRASGMRAPRPRQPALSSAALIEGARDQWESATASATHDSDPVRSTWDAPILITGAVLVAACALTLLAR